MPGLAPTYMLKKYYKKIVLWISALTSSSSSITFSEKVICLAPLGSSQFGNEGKDRLLFQIVLLPETD